MATNVVKARISSPGKVGSVPSDYDAELVRTFIAEGTVKFGRAACIGSDGDHAKVYAGAGATFAGLPLIAEDAEGVNTEDTVAKTVGQYEDKDVMGLMQTGFGTGFVEEAVTELDAVRVRHTEEAATSGYQAINFDEAIIGSAVPEIPAETYDLDITVDGTLWQVTFDLLPADDWDGIALKIQTDLRAQTSEAETVVVAGGTILVTSSTTGDTSTILIAAGTAGSGGGDFITAIQVLSTTGSQGVSSTPTTFIGATVAGISAEDYDLDVKADTTATRQLVVSLTATDDWNTIAAALQVALRLETGSTETVTIAGGQILVTSAKQGTGSAIRISAGTAGSGGGDLLAAIDALVGYATTVEDPADGSTTASGATIGAARAGQSNPSPLMEPGNFCTTAEPGKTARLVGVEFRGVTSGAGPVALLLLQPVTVIDD